ncbi:transketolase [uncultured Sphaerochaeta sp.]|uniref:transketolase n=1 Tax=uncultured Sphaerochaeta sp. TaxID=886478 RepID=UPI002A0A822D|nr:transketolase [uncultured Sphaerochaeta sp.]
MKIQELKLQAMETRKTLLKMIYNAKTGHTGGSLSSADIMTALFFDILNIDAKNPEWDGRDRFILSKGHCIEGYLAVLAEKGFIEKEELRTFSQYESRLIGHPNNKIPGIEMNTGALGHGLSIGVGMALGLKKDHKSNKVYVLMGDGEQEEGSIWEAAMAGANYHLDNLIGIVDRNHLQISGKTEDVMNLEPLASRWSAFGWSVREIDGNDMEEIIRVFHEIPFEKGKPSLVLANTIKGKGVSEMENIARWHHGVPDEKLFISAMNQFDTTLKELAHASI